MKRILSWPAVACIASVLLVSRFTDGVQPYPLGGGGLVRVQHLATGVAAPQIITVTTNAQTLFTEHASAIDGRVLVRTMQNTGTTPVLYAIGTPVSATNYHGVLAGGTAARDGLGSVVDLSAWRGTISVATESGTSVVVLTELTQ